MCAPVRCVVCALSYVLCFVVLRCVVCCWCGVCYRRGCPSVVVGGYCLLRRCCRYVCCSWFVSVVGVMIEECWSLFVVCCLLWSCGHLLCIVGVGVCCASCACWLLLVLFREVLFVGAAFVAAVWLSLVDCCWLLLRVVYVCCSLLLVVAYSVLRVGCGVACCLLGAVSGLLCVVRCFPVLLSVCWWYFVGVRCLRCVVCCFTYVVCGVRCIDGCWMLCMVVWYVLFVGVDGVLFDSLIVDC